MSHLWLWQNANISKNSALPLYLAYSGFLGTVSDSNKIENKIPIYLLTVGNSEHCHKQCYWMDASRWCWMYFRFFCHMSHCDGVTKCGHCQNQSIDLAIAVFGHWCLSCHCFRQWQYSKLIYYIFSQCSSQWAPVEMIQFDGCIQWALDVIPLFVMWHVTSQKRIRG